MLINRKKTKSMLTATWLLSHLCSAAVVSTVVGSFLMISPTAVHAQEQDPDPIPAVEAILDTYDPGVPEDLDTFQYYNHIVGTVTGRGTTSNIDYWTPKKGGTVLIATNPVDLTQTVSTVIGPYKLHIVGTIYTWKGPKVKK